MYNDLSHLFMKNILFFLLLCVLSSCKTTENLTDTVPVEEEKIDRLAQKLSDQYEQKIWEDAGAFPLLDQGTYVGMYKHIESVLSMTLPAEMIPEDQEIWIVGHDDQYHAWLLPDGDFYITSGLLKLIKTENDLAIVAAWAYAAEETCPQWQAQVDMYTRDVLKKCCADREELNTLLVDYVYSPRSCIADSLLTVSDQLLCASVYGNNYSVLRDRLTKLRSDFSTSYPITGVNTRTCEASREKERYSYARGFLNRRPYRICNGAGSQTIIPEELDRGQLRHSSSTPRG